MSEDIIVFGTGKFAELVDLYLPYYSNYRVTAFTDDRKAWGGFRGKQVYPWPQVNNTDLKMFIAIAYSNLNKVRAEKFQEAKERGLQLISVNCSPNKWNDTKIGENVFIFENQVLQPNIVIGDNTIIWSANHFGHDVKIGKNCFITSGCVLCGEVEVGDGSYIGVNSTIRDKVKIGKNNIIGAGSLILSDTEDGQVFIGEETEPYRLNSEQFESMMDISERYEIQETTSK